MILAVKAPVSMLAAGPRQKPRLQAIVERWSLDTLLAALQILAEARGRLRGSQHGRTLVEIALLRVAMLDDLGELSDVVARLVALESGAPPISPVEKKKLTLAEPVVDRTSPKAEARPSPTRQEPRASARDDPEDDPQDLESIASGWVDWAASQPPELASKLANLRPSSLPEPGILVIEPLPGYNWLVDLCERSDLAIKVEVALRQWLNRPFAVRYSRSVEVPATPQARHPSAACPR